MLEWKKIATFGMTRVDTKTKEQISLMAEQG